MKDLLFLFYRKGSTLKEIKFFKSLQPASGGAEVPNRVRHALLLSVVNL